VRAYANAQHYNSDFVVHNNTVVTVQTLFKRCLLMPSKETQSVCRPHLHDVLLHRAFAEAAAVKHRALPLSHQKEAAAVKHRALPLSHQKEAAAVKHHALPLSHQKQ
jgi:hypothetical protein